MGTSGWSYDDWEGAVYPPGLGAPDRLPFVARALSAVEVNSTFYRDPSPATVDGWLRKVKDVAGFEITVKAPQRLTQDALAAAPPAEVGRLTREWRALVPDRLAAQGRLGAVLLQLAPAIRPDSETLARLDAALAALEPHSVAVEPRHSAWLAAEDALALAALAALDARGAALVVVDGPSFPPVEAGHADHAYVRFHGRNADVWLRGRAVEEDEDDPRQNRYDYRYRIEELAPWADRIGRLARTKAQVRAFFNNHPGGGAFVDALALMQLLRERGAPLAEPRSAQRTLF